LAILIAFIVGVAWGYQGGLQAKMKAPLRATLVKYKVSWTSLQLSRTVKRPYFDTVFSENSVFSKMFLGKPPSKFFEVCLNLEYM
jgi:hypothetical protein